MLSDWKNVQYKDGKYRTGGGGGASALNDLSDVEISSVSDGQVLKYDNTTSKWINANESSGSGQTYTGTEQVVGTWFGKPLYAKSYNATYVNASTESVIDDYDLSAISIVKMDFVYNPGWEYASSSGNWSFQPVGTNGYNSGSNVSSPKVYVYQHKLRFLNTDSGGAGIQIRGTVYYIKNAD